jgi:hypothetical protein
MVWEPSGGMGSMRAVERVEVGAYKAKKHAIRFNNRREIVIFKLLRTGAPVE